MPSQIIHLPADRECIQNKEDAHDVIEVLVLHSPVQGHDASERQGNGVRPASIPALRSDALQQPHLGLMACAVLHQSDRQGPGSLGRQRSSKLIAHRSKQIAILRL